MIKEPITNLPDPVLTPKDVARLLQISLSAVYKHSRRLGGFYPAGLRSVRFARETIYGFMEGQGSEVLVLPVSVPGQAVRRQKFPNQERRCGSQGNQTKGSKESTNQNRHGLLGSM